MKTILVFLLWLAFTFIAVSQTVYITKTGKKYHESSCGSLSSSSFELSLEEAIQQGYTACKRCNPPVSLSNTSNNELKTVVPKTETQTKKKDNKTYSTRCIAITKKGTQCKRNAEPGSNYCWQHK